MFVFILFIIFYNFLLYHWYECMYMWMISNQTRITNIASQCVGKHTSIGFCANTHWQKQRSQQVGFVLYYTLKLPFLSFPVHQSIHCISWLYLLFIAMQENQQRVQRPGVTFFGYTYSFLVQRSSTVSSSSLFLLHLLFGGKEKVQWPVAAYFGCTYCLVE